MSEAMSDLMITDVIETKSFPLRKGSSPYFHRIDKISQDTMAGLTDMVQNQAQEIQTLKKMLRSREFVIEALKRDVSGVECIKALEDRNIELEEQLKEYEIILRSHGL